MSALLLLLEAVAFAVAGAFAVAPWPWWMATFVLLAFGFLIAISRDVDTAEGARADLESETARRRDSWRDR